MDYVKEAKELGFSNAAIMDTQKLIFKPEYRRFCEENQCGCYNVNPACPPESGTVEAMKQRALTMKKLLFCRPYKADILITKRRNLLTISLLSSWHPK